MKRSIQLILIYLAMQVLAALTAGAFTVLYLYLRYNTLDTALAGRAVLVPSLLLGFVYMGWYLWRKGYLRNDGLLYALPSVPCLLYSVLAGVAAIFLADVVQSRLAFLPDWMEQSFDALQSGAAGIVCLVLLGPVLEELLFRGAVTKELLKRYKPLAALLFSGLLFGVFHINPAQVVGAALIGFLLAWVYYRTGSVVCGIVIHVLNNGLSVYTSIHYPDITSVTALLATPWLVACTVLAVVLLVLSVPRIRG
ncbi:MAG: CPBP family intramembrane metalloprotease [Prevotellaceae bacterium]|nr:CPBP family intramembrane metalloprotease [Prevotellaceae bacterium]